MTSELECLLVIFGKSSFVKKKVKNVYHLPKNPEISVGM